MKFPRKFRKPDKKGGLPIPRDFNPISTLSRSRNLQKAQADRGKPARERERRRRAASLNVTRSTTKTTMHGARIDGKVSARLRRDRTCDPVHPRFSRSLSCSLSLRRLAPLQRRSASLADSTSPQPNPPRQTFVRSSRRALPCPRGGPTPRGAGGPPDSPAARTPRSSPSTARAGRRWPTGSTSSRMPWG